MLRRHGVKIDETAAAAFSGPPCPPQLEYLMEWFGEIRGFGRAAFQGVHPITWSDVRAWREEMRVRPLPGDYRLLMQLDVRFRNAADRAGERRRKAEEAKRRTPPRR